IVHKDYVTSAQIVLGGLGGDDTITIDYSGGDPIPAAGLSVDGGDGNDILTVSGSAGNDAATLTSGYVSLGSWQFTYIITEALNLQLGAGQDTLSAFGNGAVSVSNISLNV